MENGLYHYEVYWDEEIQKQINSVLNSNLPLKFDIHAINNKFKRKISTNGITIDKLKQGYCFEAAVNNNRVIKFVIRYGYNDTYDLSSVWYPQNNCLYCKTIWLNKKDDKHYTLDECKYVSYSNKNIQHISVCIGELINHQKNSYNINYYTFKNIINLFFLFTNLNPAG